MSADAPSQDETKIWAAINRLAEQQEKLLHEQQLIAQTLARSETTLAAKAAVAPVGANGVFSINTLLLDRVGNELEPWQPEEIAELRAWLQAKAAYRKKQQ